MASSVTIHTDPFAPIAFPARCCYCLEPATTRVPVRVRVQRLRSGRYRKATFRYPVDIPYCAAHAEQSRRFNRYDRVATAALIGAGLVLLAGIQLAFGGALRALGGVAWWCGTVLLIALLVAGGALALMLGRRLLQGRHPALADHHYMGGLGVTTATRNLQAGAQGEEARLALTFTFHNDAYAAQMAALHETAAQPAAEP